MDIRRAIPGPKAFYCIVRGYVGAIRRWIYSALVRITRAIDRCGRRNSSRICNEDVRGIVAMDAVTRITVRNLLNSVAALPPEMRSERTVRGYWVALSVAKYFLGADWVEKHLRPEAKPKGFLQFSETGN